ncbi:hypothetical protein [Immundisolibacter sp.]
MSETKTEFREAAYYDKRKQAIKDAAPNISDLFDIMDVMFDSQKGKLYNLIVDFIIEENLDSCTNQ